jgi:hypothetical protein
MSKNMPKEETGLKSLLATCFSAGFLLGLFFYPKDGGEMFNRNVS